MLSPQLTGSFFTNLKEFLQRYDCFRFEEFPEVLITVRQGQSHTHKYRKRNRVRAQERGVEGLDWGGGATGQTLTHSWPIGSDTLSLSLCCFLSPPQPFQFFPLPPFCGESSNSFQTRAASSLIQALWL